MSFHLSKVVRVLSWLAVGLAALATVWCVGIILDGNYVWAAFAFGMLAASSNLGILLLAVIPSSILYYRNRESTDLNSLLLAGSSFLVLLVETLLLNLVLPMRGE